MVQFLRSPILPRLFLKHDNNTQLSLQFFDTLRTLFLQPLPISSKIYQKHDAFDTTFVLRNVSAAPPKQHESQNRAPSSRAGHTYCQLRQERIDPIDDTNIR